MDLCVSVVRRTLVKAGTTLRVKYVGNVLQDIIHEINTEFQFRSLKMSNRKSRIREKILKFILKK